jgi:hypothetical protein
MSPEEHAYARHMSRLCDVVADFLHTTTRTNADALAVCAEVTAMLIVRDRPAETVDESVEVYLTAVRDHVATFQADRTGGRH